MRLGLIATELLSLFAHGLSALPSIKLYVQQIAHLDATAPEYEAAPNRPTA